MKYIKMTLLSGVVGVLAACNGAPDGASSTDYVQPLAGGASLSITIPNDISSSSNTTINVANRPSGAVYTFAFPTPVPVINKSKTTASNLQADGNLSVTTSPTPCIIDDAHSSCQLVFNPTGAVNGTYQITPHYAAAGTVTKADTALNSFNVSVSGQPVQELAPFIVSTVNSDQSFGPLYAYKNGALQVVRTPASDEYWLVWFANVNGTPIYMTISYNTNNEELMGISYSNNGYDWKPSDTFCQAGQPIYIDAYQSQTLGKILGRCEDDNGNTISLYETVNGKTWNRVWAYTGSNPLPALSGNSPDLLFVNNSYVITSHTQESIIVYQLNNQTQVWNKVSETYDTGNINAASTNGKNILLSNYQNNIVQQSYDLGKTWQVVFNSNDEMIYMPYLDMYYSAFLFDSSLTHVYSASGDKDTWHTITTNQPAADCDCYLNGYNPVLGYIASDYNSNKLYSSPNMVNGNLQFTGLTSLPANLGLDNIVVGY